MARTPQSSGPSGENGRALRTLALIAVVIGLVALTTAACLLSYSSVHDFALRAGVTASLARIYPDIGDAMLVIAGCSVLALRGAGLVSKLYGWLCFILLLGALAASSVAHEAGLSIPLRTAEITAAAFPWALVLVAFGLLLALLRHARRRRQSQRPSAAADTVAPPPATLEPPALDLEALEPEALEPEALEPEALEPEALEAWADESTGEYEYPDEYDLAAGTSEPAPAELGVVSLDVPHPRPAVEPDDSAADSPSPPGPPGPPVSPEVAEVAETTETTGTTGTQTPRAVVRPTEMQLRARTPRQRESADPTPEPKPEPAAAQPTPPTAASVAEPPTTGFTGDTIPRGELNPAPTPAQPSAPPPELDRPHSSPTPPS